MANIKISGLPLYTGNTYNGYFIWNNSGETTTYKTKFNNTFYGVLQVKRTDFSPNTNVNTSYGAIVLGGNNNVGSTDKVNIVMGFDNNVSASGAPDAVGNFVVGRGNNLSSVFAKLNIVVGGYNSLTQGQNIRFGNNGNNTGQFNIDGGEQNNISGSQNIAWGNYISISSDYNLSLGYDNDITSSNGYNAITNGILNRITGTSEYAAIMSSSASTIGAGKYNVIIGGLGNNNSGNEFNGIYSSSNSTVFSNVPLARWNNIIGCDNVYTSGITRLSTIMSSNDSNIDNGAYCGIKGSFNSKITGGTSQHSHIIGSRNSLIIDSDYSTIIASSGSTINNLDRVVILGLHGFSATTSGTTYVDSIEAVNNVVLRKYLTLDFADDTAAAAGGVPLGGIYHTSGAVKVRIS